MSALPSVHVTTDAVGELDVDALVVPVFRGAIEGPGTDTALRALGYDEVPRDATFRGKLGEVLDLAATGHSWGRVTLLGLGRMDELSEEQVRRAAGAAARHLAPKCRTIATTLPLVQPGQAIVHLALPGDRVPSEDDPSDEEDADAEDADDESDAAVIAS